MAAHQGFSDHASELQIGHVLGLRWFHLGLNAHRVTSIKREVIDILDMSATVVMMPYEDTFTCECGFEGSTRELGNHQEGPAEPVLSGVRGQWVPGENVAVCAVNRPVFYSAGSPGGGGGSASTSTTTSSSSNWAWVGSGGTTTFAGGGVAAAGGSGGSGGGGGGEWPEGHEVPGEHCGCGFWVYWALGDKVTSSPSVVGLVKGYGEVIEGDLGFRCSHATIEAIYLPAWDQAAALAIEAHYQVDVYSNFLAMLEMYKDLTPEDQPPLTDAYFCRGEGAGAGGSVAKALRGFAYPCTGCGFPRCAQGQPLCAACQVRPPVKVAKPLGMSPAEAAKRLHGRREAWVRQIPEVANGLAKLGDQVTHTTETMEAALKYIRTRYGDPPSGRQW